MSKSLTELAADIVVAQSLHARMTAGDISEALKKAYHSLAGIKALEGAEEAPRAQEARPSNPAPDALAALQRQPLRSIRKNTVSCLECGQEFKMLTVTHLTGHGLTAKEYRKKWGFGARQALSCQTLSEKRRQTAQRLGLADKLAVARQQRRVSKNRVAPAPEPKEAIKPKVILRKKAQKESAGEPAS